MSDGSDSDVVVFAIKEHSIVTAAETQASERELQLFHITDTIGKIATHAVENLQGLIAIDGAQLGTGLRRP
jgi:hypothetical protein